MKNRRLFEKHDKMLQRLLLKELKKTLVLSSEITFENKNDLRKLCQNFISQITSAGEG